MSSIRIGQYTIGSGNEPFIIAELSGNHNQSLDRALDLVEAAAESGAHAVKLQTYTADTMTLPSEKGGVSITDEGSLWQGEDLYSLYEKASTPWEWHETIFLKAKELGMVAFSTPFDESAVDYLESLDVPAYKIASFENTDIPLLRRVAATGKPVILSTGMASISELAESVSALRSAGCKELVLLKCTSTYPAEPTDTNLMTIPHMGELFSCQVGLSDHTLGIGVSLASIALGATVVEKHFTLDREDGGVDAAFSIEPNEMKALVTESQRAWMSLGSIFYGSTDAERVSSKYRRSIYVIKDLKAGEVLTTENIRRLRPAMGLEAKYHDLVIGCKVCVDVPEGTPLTWDLLLS